MKESLIHQAYEIAKERYAELGIDTEKVLEQNSELIAIIASKKKEENQ